MNESIQEATERTILSIKSNQQRELVFIKELKQDVVQVRNSIHSTYALQHHERTAHEERKRRYVFFVYLTFAKIKISIILPDSRPS